MTRLLTSTPKQDGYRMPAEWEPHKQTWMLWPYRSDVWRFGGKPVQKTFVKLATAISEFEPVTVGATREQFQVARAALPDTIRVVEMSYNDIWARDNGPTFLIDNHGGLRCVDWEFNAWGGLEDGLMWPWDQDNLVPQKIAGIENIDRYKPENFVLEGGSIHVDGEGTLLTTEECLLNSNRNPHLSQKQIEEVLLGYTGCDKVIWLGKGARGDVTGGHIDNFACFIRPGAVALHWVEDPNDPQHEISAAAYERLITTTDAKGRRLEVHKINAPRPSCITAAEAEGYDVIECTLPLVEGQQVDHSYLNFYICNGGAIVPTFGDRNDEIALGQLQALMPERKVVGIHAREVAMSGGIFHCITQQQPALGRSEPRAVQTPN